MHKAARPSGGVGSSNPHHWRGKRLHHHGGDVCCVFELCVAVSLVMCKKVPEHNLKVPFCLTMANRRYFRLLFDPPTRAPYNTYWGLVKFSGFLIKNALK